MGDRGYGQAAVRNTDSAIGAADKERIVLPFRPAQVKGRCHYCPSWQTQCVDVLMERYIAKMMN